MSLLTHEEINLINNDSKYKSYINAVEKSLKNFESSSEWADLISSLGKLKKVLQSFPRYQYIPKRVSVCKRLAQCLHPALPSGVHLKALEVYIVIFQNIRLDMLAKDLCLYTSGLFPLLANAALSVKPVLLDLYETYFIPLKKSLRPCLTGLIIALLPGLEEGSEFYTRTFNLLKSISQSQSDSSSVDSAPPSSIADDKYFYTSLWSAIISQSSIRFPAIQFIMTNFETHNKLNTNRPVDDQLYLIGNSIDLMINAICCCLQDTNPLVQRTILDLICACLPMNTNQITKNDKINLTVVAIHVILRRDMSLNRRIYTWFMGSSTATPQSGQTTPASDATPNGLDEPQQSQQQQQQPQPDRLKSNEEENYFNTYTKQLLITSIKLLLLNNKRDSTTVIQYLFNEEASLDVSTTASSTATTLKLLKIVSNLVERQEIGQAIIDDILLDLLYYVYRECYLLTTNSSLMMKKTSSLQQQHSSSTSASNMSKELSEIKKATCNFLFQSFQLYFIWEFCANKFEAICRNYTNRLGANTNEFGQSSYAAGYTVDSNNEMNMMNVSPAQLCDLYEFILDLLASSDFYNEIQTEYLPLMLKRITHTINTYCSKMTNLDLSKSFLLCIKILNKVVPKIIFPDSNMSSQPGKKTIDKKLTKAKANSKDGDLLLLSKQQPVQQSIPVMKPLQRQLNTDGVSLDIDHIVSRVIDDIIDTIENTTATRPVVSPTPVNDDQLEDEEEEEEDDDENNNRLIDSCLANLKQLCHTFVRSHLFASVDTSLDQLEKSFRSLFFDEAIHFSKMKPDCLNYLQSFQILNKLLIKILLFPREQRNHCVDAKNEVVIVSWNENGQDVDELSTFEDWIKDLFVISCASVMSNVQTSTTSKLNTATNVLFEFQSITLNTIIELIHLSESVNSHFDHQSSTKRVDTSNQSVCLLQTIFNKRQIDLIFTSCKFANLTANMLWSNLVTGSSSRSASTMEMAHDHLMHVSAPNTTNISIDKRAAILFCLLHELLPNNLCEDIISSNLLWTIDNGSFKERDVYNTASLNGRMDAFKRFARLWHWSRELATSTDSLVNGAGNSSNTALNDAVRNEEEEISVSTIKYTKLTKTFERSLLILLEMLADKDTPTTLSKLIKEWLISCICEYNDLPRILDILVVSLLHPSTARVSVQLFLNKILAQSASPSNQLISSTSSPNKSIAFYLNDELNSADGSSGQVTESSSLIRTIESKVYAISNEGGNVKYHVNDPSAAASSTYQSANRANSKPAGHEKTFLLTSIDQSIPNRPLKNVNIELPLSILNPASLTSQGSGISVRINPFGAAKTPTADSNMSDDFHNEFNNDLTDNADSSAKNAKLLENYKALKVGQLKQQQQQKNPTLNNRLSNSSSSLTASISPRGGKDLSMNSSQKTPSDTTNNISMDVTNETNDSSSSSSAPKRTSLEAEQYESTSGVVVTDEPVGGGSYDDDDGEANFDDEDDDPDEPDENDEEADFYHDIYPNDIYNENDDDETTNDPEVNCDYYSGAYSSQTRPNNMNNGADLVQPCSGDEEYDQSHDESNASRSTELTTLAAVANEKHSPSLLKKFSKIKLTKKVVKLSKSSSEKSSKVATSTDPAEAHKYFKKFKFKRTTKDKGDKAVDKSVTKLSSKTSAEATPNHAQTASSQQQLQIPSQPQVQQQQQQQSTQHGAKTISPRNQFLKTTINRELTVDAANLIDVNYAYMLVYVNCNNIKINLDCNKSSSHGSHQSSAPARLLVTSLFSNTAYDHVRIMFVLKCVDQLLSQCERDFLIAITTTSLTSNSYTAAGNKKSPLQQFNPVISVHNEKLLDLILRHLKSIYGLNFYAANGSSSAFSSFNLNNTTYLEAITLLLLFYIRSYYPPSIFYLKLQPSQQASLMFASTNRSMSKSNSVSTTSLHSNTTQTSATTNTLTPTSHANPPPPSSSSCSSSASSSSDEELFNENRNVQIYCLRLLCKLMKELSELCKSSSLNQYLNRLMNKNSHYSATSTTNSLVWYQSIIDLLDKCKLQKTLLHCFYSTITTPGQNTLAQCILTTANVADHNCRRQIEFTYLGELMHTLEHLTELERILNDYQTIIRFYRSGTTSSSSSARPTVQMTNSESNRLGTNMDATFDDDFLITNRKSSSTTGATSVGSTRYIANQIITNQSMFISTVLHYLKHINLVEYHLSVLKLIKNSLPSSGVLLKTISTYVIEQLCRNLLYITSGGVSMTGSSSGNNLLPLIAYMSSISSSINIPDFVITILKELSFMLNYSLIVNSNASSSSIYLSLNILMNLNDFTSSIAAAGAQSGGATQLSATSTLGTGSSATSPSSQSSTSAELQFKLFRQFQSDNEINQMQARECLINLLPSVLSTMAQVWQKCNLLLNSFNLYGINVLFEQHIQQSNQYSWVLGHPLTIKQCITDLLNPIAVHHSAQFMIAIGTVWGEKRKKSRVFLEHKVIIELIKSLKSFPISVILQNICDILKQPNHNNVKDKKKSPLNIWLLQFLHSYLDNHMTSIKSRISNNSATKTMNDTVLNNELASSLCTFLKESLSSAATSNFATACYFQLFRILHDSVNNFPLLVDDKKYTKDIQDVTHKLFELCNSIVASSLQQTTWLRKNYAVKLAPQQQISAGSLSASSSLPLSTAGGSTVSMGNTAASTTGSTSSNTGQMSTNSSHSGLSSMTQMTNSLISNHSSNSGNLSNNPSNAASMNSLVTGSNVSGLLIHNDSNSTLTSATANNQSSSVSASNSSSGYVGSSGLISVSTNANSQSSSQAKSNDNYHSFSDMETDAATNLNSIDSLNGVGDSNDANNNLIHSLHALNILAEYLAKTLDIVYKSDEKDRLVVPLLVNLMSNLWPYLKTHSVANKNNFRAASHLLMSLTVYPYTRKTWKKEVYEMLFDNLYFHVDSQTLEYFKSIVDNLISNDRAMFKDVLSRVTYQQSGGLFTSKEQESELKAQLLKRLAFVIYSSEKDQYQKNMPEIQECIAHVLKLTQSANLYSTLFLLFRILILRISSRHLIALWPTIISELIIILLQIEQELSEDLETNILMMIIKKTNSKNNTNYLDHIANTTTSYQHSNNSKMQIFLSGCKLIDLILTLPNSLTPQFQLYKWSFINTEDALNLKQKDQFVPYLVKINNLLKIKYSNNRAQTNFKFAHGPLIRQRSITSLLDLKPFFDIVTTHAFVHDSSSTNLINNNQYQQTQNLLTSTNLKLFELQAHEDFLEGWIQS